jgi:hypothetical protein
MRSLTQKVAYAVARGARLQVTTLALCCCAVVAAPPRSLNLDGEVGCDTLEAAQGRWSSLKIAMQIGLGRQQGVAVPPALMQLENVALERFAKLSRENCRRLTGPFKVLERQPYTGGISMVRVVFGSGSLWVAMP